jgi:hypothetical protein
LLPAGELRGIGVGFVGETDVSQLLQRSSSRLVLRQSEHLLRREADVPQRRAMGEEVERLKHDPQLGPDAVDVDSPIVDALTVDENLAGCRLLEEVHTAQQRALAGARRADDAQNLVRRHGKVNAV